MVVWCSSDVNHTRLVRIEYRPPDVIQSLQSGAHGYICRVQAKFPDGQVAPRVFSEWLAWDLLVLFMGLHHSGVPAPSSSVRHGTRKNLPSPCLLLHLLSYDVWRVSPAPEGNKQVPGINRKASDQSKIFTNRFHRWPHIERTRTNPLA